jgi:hypothetical protein
MHCPFWHVSPEPQAVLFGSLAVQLLVFSLHDSVQSTSPSAPGHGLPVWRQIPVLLHTSVPLQYRLSLQDVPAGLIGCVHKPLPLQTSLVQTLASAVQELFAATKQLSAASLQTLAQTGPPAQGSPECTVQAPALQASVPLQ